MKTPARQPITFIDLAAQQQQIRGRIDVAIALVLDHGNFIMGPEIAAFEADLSAFCGARHAISCANGTEALAMVLMAQGVRPGHAIFVPTFTFAATAEVVTWLGATPVFVDCLDDTYNMDPRSLSQAIDVAKRLGLAPKAVIPVDLFGQPADYASIETIAEENGLFVLCDSAQSFGASYHGRKVGTIGMATTTSFFPAKPLGCYGDGGAIFTDNADLAHVLKSLRVHGKGSDKYDNVRIGLNSRLDTIQAAILIEKLAIFGSEIGARNRLAARYSEMLAGHTEVPHVPPGLSSVWAQYTVRVPATHRHSIAAALRERGVPTAVYYPKPLHQQTAYRHFPFAGNALPASERVALEVLSLPMHPYLDDATQDHIVGAFIETIGKFS
jgi:dTDP-4-amino-4,6-dideoxygalactose transaminase